jgi:SAM-dependent methyltransferase
METMGESSVVSEKLAQNFLSTTYGNHKFTAYPRKLCEYLSRRFEIATGSKILDVGCGRGEFLQGFSLLGVDAVGVDQGARPNLLSEDEYFSADISKALPFEDSSFDVVFNKSVLEHFYFPENLALEMNRVLKPGGRIITMTPSWIHNQKGFYVDFTHRTPFTIESLGDLHRIVGFENVEVEYFTQLPLVWRFDYLRFVTFLLRHLVPGYTSKASKTIRFSKELMLLGVGTKAAN